WAGHTKGWGAYQRLAVRYVSEFEAKWTSGTYPVGEPLLGTPDLQSLADLTNSANVAREMRWVTIGPRLLTTMTMAAVAPLIPLLLFEYPLADLAAKVIKHLVGL